MRSKGHFTIAKNPDRKVPGGVIPINSPAPKSQPNNKPAPRLKLIIRRLPPALTQDEFLSALGDDWRVGNGRVDWFSYRSGKIKSGTDHSKQSCAYLRLTDANHIQPLEATFLAATFHDAKGSHRDPALLTLLPRIGYAPSQKIPNARQRNDARQGTIDQDPEFQAFLVSLTEPVVKTSPDTSADGPRAKVTTTPLIEALRLKKTKKAKPTVSKSKPVKDPRPATTKASARARQVSQPALNGRKVKEVQRPEASAEQDAGQQTRAAGKDVPAAKVERRRGPAQTFQNIIARDLGLDKSQKRGAKNTKSIAAATDSAQAVDPAILKPEAKGPAKAEASSETAALVRNRKQRDAKPRGVSSDQTQKPAATVAPPSRAASSCSEVSPDSTKSYLKHTNPSQGITVSNLTEALSKYGDVVTVTIDSRKGTGMAEFRTPSGLKAAMAQRHVSVAQGAVEVLEFRKEPAGRRNQRNKGRNERPAKGVVDKAVASTTGPNRTHDKASTNGT